MTYHNPVMLAECLEGLNLAKGGIYVDATFGGGGHSKEILKYVGEGRLIAFDQDFDAFEEAKKIDNRSFTFFNTNFRYISQYLKLAKINEVDGILADLGVSSHQFDAPERGFSFRHKADLDMRMNTNTNKSALDVINEYNADELSRMFRDFGELRESRRVAREIVKRRLSSPIRTTSDLVDTISHFSRPKSINTFLARVFQAIRLEVNDEINALKDFLTQSQDILKPGGRLVVLSYHSLEDRLVKNLLKTGNVDGKVEKDFYGNLITTIKPITRKPLVAKDEEIMENNRARSAKLRIGEKI